MPPQPERGEQDDEQPQDLFALPADERVQAARDLFTRAPQQPIEPAAPFEAPTARCYVEGARPRIKMSEMPQLTV